MTHRKLIAGVVALALVGGGATVALAAKGTPPKRATIKATVHFKVKINRYVQDFLRWQKDTYQVRSGGTLHIVNDASQEGPHTFTVVKESDEPKTPGQINQCKICQKLGEAHGADPNSEAPPKFLYLENGVGQDTPPNVDQPGDSAFIDAKQGASVDLPVTAKKGKVLYFMCLIHPWMQAKVLVR